MASPIHLIVSSGFRDNLFKCPDWNTEVFGGSLLSLLSLSVHCVAGLIPSSISLGPSVNWYIALTPFETIFLHLVILQLLLLRYLQILPINVNDFVNGVNLFGRKKRSFNQQFCQQDDVSLSLLKLLRQLDKDDCGVRTLCELEASYNLRSSNISDEAILILSALRVSRKRKRALESSGRCDADSESKPWAIAPFEEAVFLGSGVNYQNSTICEARYMTCPLNKEDILVYVNQIFMSLD